MDCPLKSIFVWNCRGAASSSFVRMCKQYLDTLRPDIVVVMETRVDPSRLRRSFQILGFDGFSYSNVQGYAGGIIAAWKKDRVRVQVVQRHFQFLHLQVQAGDGVDWFFTPVYASPSEELRRDLWQQLHDIASNMRGRWLTAGDFNEIANVSEKKGGAQASQRKCDAFMRRINDCRLMDLGAVGSRFTWKGPLFNGWSRIYERLDRAMCNSDWRLRFDEAFVKVLPRVDFSDHHPLAIFPYGQQVHGSTPPFRFVSAWMTHPSFKEVVEQHWLNDRECLQNVKHMEAIFNDWKNNVFGNVRARKKSLLARIGGIQKRVQEGCTNRFLQRLEKELQKELDQVLYQEELIWFQKSRAKWLTEGDRNTKYYHLKTINRRRRNRILMLRNGDGQWIDDVDALKGMVNNFYKDLFSVGDHHVEWSLSRLSFLLSPPTCWRILLGLLRRMKLKEPCLQWVLGKPPVLMASLPVSINATGILLVPVSAG